MQPRHFLSRISSLLLITISAAVFKHGTAEWRHKNRAEIQFSPPHIHYDITSAELWRW